MKTECDHLNGWIKKGSHTQKSHPKWWFQRYSCGLQKIFFSLQLQDFFPVTTFKWSLQKFLWLYASVTFYESEDDWKQHQIAPLYGIYKDMKSEEIY